MILGEFDEEGKPVITREPYVSRFICIGGLKLEFDIELAIQHLF